MLSAKAKAHPRRGEEPFALCGEIRNHSFSLFILVFQPRLLLEFR